MCLCGLNLALALAKLTVYRHNNSVVYIIMGIPNHLSEDFDMTISECIVC